MHGGNLIANVMKAHGVKYLFTLCGGHISPILLGADNNNIKVIDVRHEATAVFAADAIYRLTGIPGVASVTAGPGVTNTITALKNAQMAQSALILLGGATATVLKGRGSLQDIDQKSIVGSCVKWYVKIKHVRDIVPTMTRAFFIAQSGVPGPVFIELPIDTLYPPEVVKEWYGIKSDKKMDFFEKIFNYYLKRRYNSVFNNAFQVSKIIPMEFVREQIQDKVVKRVADIVKYAKKPLLIISNQAMYTRDVNKLIRAVEKLNIPTYLSSTARGLLGKNHPLHIRHKRRDALRESDCVILAGAPMDFRIDYGRQINRKAKLIMINLDKNELRKNQLIKRANMRVIGDPANLIIKLSKLIQIEEKDWLNHLQKRNKLRDDEITRKSKENMNGVNPLKLAKILDELIDDNSMLIGDGGDFIGTISYIVQPRRPLSWLDPGVFGTLGSGGGFALASKLSRDAEVWLLYGDGSAAYSINEFDTYCRIGLPIIAIIGNDGGWTQIAREQNDLFDNPVGTVLNQSNYEKIAEAYGGIGLKITSDDEIEKVLKEAKQIAKNGKPVIINALLAKSDFRKGSISM